MTSGRGRMNHVKNLHGVRGIKIEDSVFSNLVNESERMGERFPYTSKSVVLACTFEDILYIQEMCHLTEVGFEGR